MSFGKLTEGMGMQGPRMLFQKQARSKPILTIELIPKSTWAKNIRSLMPKDVWDILRKAAYKKARYKCEICSDRGPDWPVECHERWEFDRSSRIQKLSGLIALCPDCHAVKHWGYSHIKGKEVECRDHLALVNSWTKDQIDAHMDEVFVQWKALSRIQWDIDLTALTRYGIGLDTVRALYAGRSGTSQVGPDVASDAYTGPEEEPMSWEDVPEDCL